MKNKRHFCIESLDRWIVHSCAMAFFCIQQKGIFVETILHKTYSRWVLMSNRTKLIICWSYHRWLFVTFVILIQISFCYFYYGVARRGEGGSVHNNKKNIAITMVMGLWEEAARVLTIIRMLTSDNIFPITSASTFLSYKRLMIVEI